jgi:hypothetical protein
VRTGGELELDLPIGLGLPEDIIVHVEGVREDILTRDREIEAVAHPAQLEEVRQVVVFHTTTVA